VSFYWPTSFDPEHELRDWDTLMRTIQGRPEGVFWPVLGARRSGKTWALRALVHGLGEAAFHVQLEQIPQDELALPSRAQGQRFLMLDEPGRHLFHETPPEELRTKGWRKNIKGAGRLLKWLQCLVDEEHILTLALTPAEWEVMLEAGASDGLVNERDLEYGRLGPLRSPQARRLAKDERQRELLAALSAGWRRSPFLLAAIFRHALDTPGTLRDGTLSPERVRALERETIEELCISPKGSYLHYVLDDCLPVAQREVLRSVAHGVPGRDAERRLLLRLGLLTHTPSAGYAIGDPVLADHFPAPVRIHHVSDLHFGPKTAMRVDAKDDSKVGRELAAATGQGPVRDDYLDWLTQLDPAQRPHLLVVSGDVGEHGLDEQLECGREWIERVAALLIEHPGLGPDEPRVLLVPGNHDVDWAASDDEAGRRKRHLPFVRVFGANGWPFPHLEEPAATREPAHQLYRGIGLGFALLGSPESGGVTHERAGRIDPGLVNNSDIQRLRAESWATTPVRVAVVHHPLSSNTSIATEVAPYAGLINGGQLEAALREQGFRLLLHGHTHAAHVEAREGLVVAGAGTLGSRETYERHGFNEIVVSREGDRYEVQVQVHERKAGTFVTSDGRSFELVDE